MNKESGFVWKLGMFVILGLLLLVVTIYFVGKQKNMFGSTFQLKSQFRNVSGLKAGNNVRFAGIDVGTVDDIEMITDTCVTVNFVIKNEVRQFIKTDARASIGSDGLMGDKVLIIYPGNTSNQIIKNDGVLASTNALEMEDIMQSVKKSVDNAGIITAQLAEFTFKMNNGKGSLSKLISDEEFANSLKNTLMNLQTSSGEFAKFTYAMNNGKGPLSRMVNDEKLSNTLDSTITNLKTGSKAMSEDLEAAKSNFLLRGFFKDKKKIEAKRIADLKKQEELKKRTELLSVKDSSIH